MKSRTVSYSVLTLLAVLLFSVIALSQADRSASKDIRLLTIAVKADKLSYLPGELITLDFRIVNDSKGPVEHKAADVGYGNLQVLISDESNHYKKYKGPRWGLTDSIGGMATLGPGDSYKTTATVLHNHRIETSHLTERAAAEISKDLIKTDYAFPVSGTHFIKAILFDGTFEKKIESEPIKILIEEPNDIDLEIWNGIKGDGDYAYFIQTGGLPEVSDGPRTQRVKATLDEIERSGVISRYSVQIRAALSKHRAALEKQK